VISPLSWGFKSHRRQVLMYPAKNKPQESSFTKPCGHVPMGSFEKNRDAHTGSFQNMIATPSTPYIKSTYSSEPQEMMAKYMMYVAGGGAQSRPKGGTHSKKRPLGCTLQNSKITSHKKHSSTHYRCV